MGLIYALVELLFIMMAKQKVNTTRAHKHSYIDMKGIVKWWESQPHVLEKRKVSQL